MGLKGNQVKVLSGPATVTGDELLGHWDEKSWEGAGKMNRKPGDLPVGFLVRSLRRKGGVLF